MAVGRATALAAAVITIGLIFSTAALAAGSRGVTVKLKASEAAGAPVSETVRLYSNSHALVIGIDNYTNGWPRLSNAVKDAQLIERELRGRGFNVQLKTNLAAGALEEALEDFFIDKGSDPNARLLVWFAGHGHTERGKGYLVPADGPLPQKDTRGFRRKALSMRRIGDMVRDADAKHVLAVFDSCFAGTVFESARTAPPPAITRVTTQPVRQFLTSGDAGQTVADDGKFRRLFIEALQGKRSADANADGYLTASELGLFLTDSISNYTSNKQTPHYGKLRDPDFDRGDFVFKMASLGASALAPGSGGGMTPETLFWQSIKDSRNADDFKDYLAQFPNGTFAGLARRKVDDLSGPRYQVASLDTDMVALKRSNVRREPSAQSAKVGLLSPGEKVSVTGSAEAGGATWYRIALAGGRSGFVFGALLGERVAPAPQVAVARPAPIPARPAPRPQTQQPLTSSEMNMAVKQLAKCWNLPAGAKDAGSLEIEIHTVMNQDGTVREARIANQARMHGDPHYRALAESALRAVLNPRCSPLKLPLEKYDEWQVLNLVFNPQQATLSTAPTAIPDQKAAEQLPPGPTPTGIRSEQRLTLAEIQAPRHARRLLKSLGYYSGPEGGALNRDARKAIEQFQLSHGLLVTGQVDADLLAALRAAQAQVSAVLPAPDLQQSGSARPIPSILPRGTPREKYIFALGFFRKEQYEDAEVALSAFLKAHGDHALASNARFWLGETFYVRDDYIRAAENFLEGFQSNPKGQKAPDILLKLGMSMANLDKRREACAAFRKLAIEYTDAPANIKRLVARERSRNACE